MSQPAPSRPEIGGPGPTGPESGGPKITVILPTRERLPVLRHSIRTVLEQRYDRLDILVSDNFSTDGTRAFVESIDDPRVRYVNPGRRVSMSENYEFALSHVGEGWLMFLGDDDGLMPGAIADLAAVVAGTEHEAVVFRACTYFWPSPTDPGHLTVPLTGGREVRDSRAWLDKVMKIEAGFTDLPVAYQRGLVKFDAIDRIRRKSGGTFFRSCLPDIYSAVALASELPAYLFLDRAFAVSGKSKYTTGGSWGVTGADQASGAGYRQFMTESNLPFHPDIPLTAEGAYPPSCETLVHECYLQSAFLRPAGSAYTPGHMLECALADTVSVADDAANTAWGRLFAERHGLDFARHQRAAAGLRRRLKLRAAFARVRSALSRIVVDGGAVPMRSVFEASVVAGTMTWFRPSVPVRVWKAYEYRFGSVRKRRLAAALRAAHAPTA